VLGCLGCHGNDLTGEPWIEDPNFAILFTSNLTRAVPRYSDAQLAHAIRFGSRPDGSPLWDMPSHIFTDLSEPDMKVLIAWLRTVKPAGAEHPRIVIGPEGRRLIQAGEVRPEPEMVRENRAKGPAALDGRHDWARYMIRATCTECHGIELKGDQDPADGPGSPDLVIAGGYSREEFRHLLRTGEPTGGRTLALMADVARGRFAHLTDREVDAIYDYLKARAEQP
jgi:cytochrome c553